MNTKTLTLANVNVGDTLPELSIQITPKLVVAGALASRDYTRVHHDKTHAQSQGLQDIIMNTHTTKGFIGRYITDWAGPGASIKRVTLRLGAPNYPGDTMKFKGTIQEKDEAEGRITIQFTGANSWGDHATGTVTLALPTGN